MTTESHSSRVLVVKKQCPPILWHWLFQRAGKGGGLPDLLLVESALYEDLKGQYQEFLLYRELFKEEEP